MRSNDGKWRRWITDCRVRAWFSKRANAAESRPPCPWRRDTYVKLAIIIVAPNETQNTRTFRVCRWRRIENGNESGAECRHCSHVRQPAEACCYWWLGAEAAQRRELFETIGPIVSVSLVFWHFCTLERTSIGRRTRAGPIFSVDSLNKQIWLVHPSLSNTLLDGVSP